MPVAVVASHRQIVEIQRKRLLVAALGALEELGYGQVTVAEITARARVSRRTFYELFANRDECLEAAFESVVELLADELAGLDLERLPWRERVHAGLWAILFFFERQPSLARVCVVSALGGNAQVLERRRRILASLAAVIDEGRFEGARGAGCTELMAEGLIGAAFAIVHARLLDGERERAAPGRLTDVFGELMGIIVLPYLGPAAARREESRAAPRPLGRRRPRRSGVSRAGGPAGRRDDAAHLSHCEGARGGRRAAPGEQPAGRQVRRHLRPGPGLEAPPAPGAVGADGEQQRRAPEGEAQRVVADRHRRAGRAQHPDPHRGAGGGVMGRSSAHAGQWVSWAAKVVASVIRWGGRRGAPGGGVFR